MQLCLSVQALATDPRPAIQDRVCSAFRDALVKLRPEDFVDEESRVRFTAIRETLTNQEPIGGEGSIAATASAMSDDQARRVAEQICELDEHYRPPSYFQGKSITDSS